MCDSKNINTSMSVPLLEKQKPYYGDHLWNIPRMHQQPLNETTSPMDSFTASKLRGGNKCSTKKKVKDNLLSQFYLFPSI